MTKNYLFLFLFFVTLNSSSDRNQFVAPELNKDMYSAWHVVAF